MVLLSGRRLLVLCAVALLVPIQAVAGGGGEGGGLSVTASLDHCGVGSGGIICKIDASWGGVDGADRYTATVSAPDGSEHGLGAVAAGGSASAWVPFAGNGVYTVTVTAWGADESGRDRRVLRERATVEAETSVKAVGAAKAAPDQDLAEQAPGEAEGSSAPEETDPAAEVEQPAPAAEQPEEDEADDDEDEDDEEATSPLSSGELGPTAP